MFMHDSDKSSPPYLHRFGCALLNNQVCNNISSNHHHRWQFLKDLPSVVYCSILEAKGKAPNILDLLIHCILRGRVWSKVHLMFDPLYYFLKFLATSCTLHLEFRFCSILVLPLNPKSKHKRLISSPIHTFIRTFICFCLALLFCGKSLYATKAL